MEKFLASLNTKLVPAENGTRTRAAIQKARDYGTGSGYNSGYMNGYADALKELYNVKYYHVSGGDLKKAIWGHLTPGETKVLQTMGYDVGS